MIEYCRKYDAGRIIIGSNKEWKPDSRLSKKKEAGISFRYLTAGLFK